jgi:16S rRNA C967 or C1407 C5-methylase (RsmB/RsmF family)
MFITPCCASWYTESVHDARSLCRTRWQDYGCANSLPEGSLLFANETVRLRGKRAVLKSVAKFGHPDVIVTSNAAADYGKSGLRFDVILADVPCSGEGMFRKDEGAIDEWSAEIVNSAKQLQRSSVEDVGLPSTPWRSAHLLATCTFNALE